MSASAEHPADLGPGIHVIPLGDWREHLVTWACWCAPERDSLEPDVWVHRAMDQRERYASGELRPQ